MPSEIHLIRGEGLIRYAEFAFECDHLCQRVSTVLANKITPGELRMALTLIVEEELEAQERSGPLATRRTSVSKSFTPPQPPTVPLPTT